MLVNGTKLKYRTSSSGDYTAMTGIKEMPDFGTDPNKVENSSIEDEYKQYELGQKDAGDIQFRFRYRTAAEKTQYTTIRGFESAGTLVYWCVEFKDGMTIEFTGSAATRLLTAGGPDTPVDWQLNIGLSSDFTITPASGNNG